MPCRDGRDSGYHDRVDKDDAKVYKAQAKLYKDRCDELARLLCTACQREIDGDKILTDPAIASWWETHQAQDRVNAQTERMRAMKS